jgi:allophanate hydrolase
MRWCDHLCDLVGFAVPAGLDAHGRPVGVTLLGPAWSEGRLAGIADALHRNVTHATPPPPAGHDMLIACDGLTSDETALFCIGAHMSGLPLNHQLTALGGRFLRAARTAPAYRLYALGDRPGLVRVSQRGASGGPTDDDPIGGAGIDAPRIDGPAIGGAGIDGPAIAGEVWALPTVVIGKLLAQVPPPLGFGVVTLADGPCLGFLAEAAGVEGAEDITRFGGWRGWLAARDAA